MVTIDLSRTAAVRRSTAVAVVRVLRQCAGPGWGRGGMSGVAAVDRDRLRQRRQDATREIEAQERQRAAAQRQSVAEEEQTAAPECWICYSGTSEGELISPCRCRGSMQWVHRDCLHRWIITRVTEYQPGERGHDTAERFACPNCGTPFEFVGPADDGQPLGNAIWPSSGRWWLPNMFPRIDRLAEIDADVYDNFRWKFASPLACTAVQAMLVGFTIAQVWQFAWSPRAEPVVCALAPRTAESNLFAAWHRQLALLVVVVQTDGWGHELELRDVTRKGLQSSPVLGKGMPLAVARLCVQASRALSSRIAHACGRACPWWLRSTGFYVRRARLGRTRNRRGDNRHNQ